MHTPTDKSNCCNAEVTVEGSTTQYYVCSSCGKACDVHSPVQTIKTFYNLEPVLETKADHGGLYGLHRDRMPDNGWSEFRWGLMQEGSHNLSEVPLTETLKKILTEDIIEYYKGAAGYEKLKEFGLLK